MRATQRLLDFALYVAVFFSLLTDWIALSPEQMENANYVLGDASGCLHTTLGQCCTVSGQEIGCYSPCENNQRPHC